MRYPWQQKQWQHLHRARQAGRLPHALLVSGVEGLGKLDFARLFVQALYCTQHTDMGLPCRTCQACYQFYVGTLPDVLEIMPETEDKQIPVDDIRRVGDYFGISSVNKQYRCVIIHSAANMNTASMNALLKTLEEPPGNALLILVTSRPERLTATIRSRCQKVSFSVPPVSETLQWLQANGGDAYTEKEIQSALVLANNAPLKALAWLKNEEVKHYQELVNNLFALFMRKKQPVELAAYYEKQKIDGLLMRYVLEALKQKALFQDDAVSEDAILYTAGQAAEKQAVYSKMNVQNLWECMEKLVSYRRSAAVSLNPRLFLEDIFIALTGKSLNHGE